MNRNRVVYRIIRKINNFRHKKTITSSTSDFLDDVDDLVSDYYLKIFSGKFIDNQIFFDYVTYDEEIVGLKIIEYEEKERDTILRKILFLESLEADLKFIVICGDKQAKNEILKDIPRKTKDYCARNLPCGSESHVSPERIINWFTELDQVFLVFKTEHVGTVNR